MTYILYLDLKKAYDLVPHSRLIEKVKRMGYGPKLIRYIENMYKETTCAVRIQGRLSEAFKYERGVRQGCPMSPDLFNIYINDMLDEIEGITVPGLSEKVKGLHFADDTVVLAETREGIELASKQIAEWCDKNNMEINVNKSGLMIIQVSDRDQINELNLRYKNETIKIVSEYEYLGINVNDKLTLEDMANQRINKGRQVAGIWNRVLKNNKINIKYK